MQANEKTPASTPATQGRVRPTLSERVGNREIPFVLATSLLLTCVGLLLGGCTAQSVDNPGQSSSVSASAATQAPTPAPTPTPSEEDLCIATLDCRLDVTGDEIRSNLVNSPFRFEIKPGTSFDGHQIYTATSDPTAVIIEWTEHEGVVSVFILGPEPATVFELGRSFISPWDSLIRGIASDVVPSPWGFDVVSWIMNSYSASRNVNGVQIEVNYLQSLQLWTVEFRKAL